MKLAARSGIVLATLLSLVGCGYWQAQPIAPRDALAAENIDQVRLTRTNGEQVVARVVEIRGDSIFGTRGTSGPVTCEQASPLCTLRLHIGDIGFVETRAFSAIKTLALIAVPVSVFALVVLIKKECQTGPAVGAC
jgi:hypothetical protein